MSSTASTDSSMRSITRMPLRRRGSLPPTAPPASTIGKSLRLERSSSSADSSSSTVLGATAPSTSRSGDLPSISAGRHSAEDPVSKIVW